MTTLKINNNGSIKVEGDFQIVDAEGKSYGLGGRTIVTLCRCGLSKTKSPFLLKKDHPFNLLIFSINSPSIKIFLFIFFICLIYEKS